MDKLVEASEDRPSFISSRYIYNIGRNLALHRHHWHCQDFSVSSPRIRHPALLIPPFPPSFTCYGTSASRPTWTCLRCLESGGWRDELLATAKPKDLTDKDACRPILFIGECQLGFTPDGWCRTGPRWRQVLDDDHGRSETPGDFRISKAGLSGGRYQRML
jgi:hypothetical protein